MEQIVFPSNGKEQVAKTNIASYSKTLFGMFNGEKTSVTIEAENRFIGILIDRFGKDIPIVKLDENHFRTIVEVAPSKLFLGWIFSLGQGIRITAPDSVTEAIREEIKSLSATYLE